MEVHRSSRRDLQGKYWRCKEPSFYI